MKRQENPEDRRTYALHLTDKGRAALSDIRRIAQEHNKAVCASLSNEERAVLGSLLLRVAQEQGLAAGVHPGYARR